MVKRIEVKPDDEYGDLTVIREVAVSASGKRQVLCKCACGQEVTVRLGHARSGHSQTCGKCGVEYNGQRKTVAEWASLFGLKESTLRARLKSGLPIGEALKRT